MTRVGVRTAFVSDPVRRESALNDISALATRGVTGVRLRINWSDIFPTSSRPDGRVVEDLAEFVARVTSIGIEVWPTLCGNRLPGWFLNEGAFADRKATDKFWSLYVDTIASAIADHAAGWIPFETPIALLHEGWRVGSRDPGFTDEAKFADAFGGLIEALAAVARLLAGVELRLSTDAHHEGATSEVLGALHEAVVRGRLALPGRITRDVGGLQGAYRGIALAFPDRSSVASSNELRRWRDSAVATVYATSERFAPLAPSIAAVPDPLTDTEHADIIDALRGVAAEVRDGGAELEWVWLGDTAAVAGLVANSGSTHVLDF